MDAPIVELPSGLCEGVERCRWPHEDALQPDGKGLDGFGRRTRLSVDLDDVGGVSGTILFSVACHRALLQLFDPLNLSLEAVADVDGEPREPGVENVPFRAAFESVGMFLHEFFESDDPTVEPLYLGLVIVFTLLNCFEQRLGDAL